MQPIKASPNVGHRFRNQQLLIFVVVVAAAAAAASRSCFFEIVCVCFSQSQRAFLISSTHFRLNCFDYHWWRRTRTCSFQRLHLNFFSPILEIVEWR